MSPLAYTPLIDPLPIWNYWMWLIVPLSAGVSVVYKSIRTESMREVPRRSLVTTLWIIGGMAFAAAALTVIVRLLEA
jgi:hypothetical protein